MKWLSDHKWVALGFMVSAAYLPGIQGSFVPRWAVIAVGVPLVSQIDPRRVPTWMLVILGFIFCIASLSIIHSPWPMAGIGELIFMLLLSLTFISTAAMVSLDDVMIGLAAGLSLSTALSVAQWLGWSPVVTGSTSPSGLFYNSEVLGEFSALIAAWFIAKFMDDRSVQSAALAVMALVPTFLSHSRIGIFVVAVALIVAWGPKWKVLLSVVGVALIGGCAAVIFTKLGESVHRITLWGTTIMSMSFRGNGLGWASAAFPFEEFSHSDMLQAVAELGFGALALLYIPFAAFRGTRGCRAEYALFAAVLVEVAVSFPLHFPATGFVSAVVAGYLVGLGPVLCGIAPASYPRHEPRSFWRGDASGADAFRSKQVGSLVSVRSVSTEPASVRGQTAGAV